MNEKLVQALTKLVQVPNQGELTTPTDTRLSRYGRVIVSLDLVTACLRETEVDLDATIQKVLKLEQELKQKTQELAAKDQVLNETQNALKTAREAIKLTATTSETTIAGEGEKIT